MNEAPAKKENSGVSLKLDFSDGTSYVITLENLLALLKKGGRPNGVSLVLAHGDASLVAHMTAYEDEYPSVTVDAMDKNGNAIYLANAELPNADYPDSITTRLYAGYGAFETDSPIAIVRTQLREQDDVERLEEQTARVEGLTKYVHIDREAACSRAWKDGNDLPEHA